MPERQAWLDGCEAEEESSGGVVVGGSCRGGGRGRGWKRMECVLRKKGEGVMEKDETTREKLGAQNYNLGKMVCEGRGGRGIVGGGWKLCAHEMGVSVC